VETHRRDAFQDWLQPAVPQNIGPRQRKRKLQRNKRRTYVEGVWAAFDAPKIAHLRIGKFWTWWPGRGALDDWLEAERVAQRRSCAEAAIDFNLNP